MLYTPPCPVVELAVLTGVLHLGSKVQLNAASHLCARTTLKLRQSNDA